MNVFRNVLLGARRGCGKWALHGVSGCRGGGVSPIIPLWADAAALRALSVVPIHQGDMLECLESDRFSRWGMTAESPGDFRGTSIG